MIKAKYRNIICTINWDDGDDQLYWFEILGCEHFMSSGHGYTIGEVIDEMILSVDRYYKDNGPENWPAKYENTDADIDLDSLGYIENIVKRNTETLLDTKYGYEKRFFNQISERSRMDDALEKLEKTAEELKELKEDYIALLWEEMRKRGLEAEGISKIIEKTEFMKELNEYPEVILPESVEKLAEELILRAAQM